jgi:hypothetical protein
MLEKFGSHERMKTKREGGEGICSMRSTLFASAEAIEIQRVEAL